LSTAEVKEFYKNHSQRKVLSPRMLKIASYFPNYLYGGKKILDVGCGNKILTTFMSVYSAEVDAIDIEEDILTYESNVKYDVVACFDLFEHLTDVPRAVQQVVKLCKPGGLILVNLPLYQDKSQPIDNLVHKESLSGLGELVFLERYGFSENEMYNFMVFER